MSGISGTLTMFHVGISILDELNEIVYMSSKFHSPILSDDLRAFTERGDSLSSSPSLGN